jgi:predicted kinase
MLHPLRPSHRPPRHRRHALVRRQPANPERSNSVTTLTITRGLPGSGKTTWARQQPGWRVNRDDLRAMLRPTWPHGDPAHEDPLTEAQHSAICALLFHDRDVIVDDTNLRQDHVEALHQLADQYGAEFVIRDFTDVPLETCIEQDAARPNPVGEHIIRGMWQRYLAPQAVAQ